MMLSAFCDPYKYHCVEKLWPVKNQMPATNFHMIML